MESEGGELLKTKESRRAVVSSPAKKQRQAPCVRTAWKGRTEGYEQGNKLQTIQRDPATAALVSLLWVRQWT